MCGVSMNLCLPVFTCIRCFVPLSVHSFSFVCSFFLSFFLSFFCLPAVCYFVGLFVCYFVGSCVCRYYACMFECTCMHACMNTMNAHQHAQRKPYAESRTGLRDAISLNRTAHTAQSGSFVLYKHTHLLNMRMQTSTSTGTPLHAHHAD